MLTTSDLEKHFELFSGKTFKGFERYITQEVDKNEPGKKNVFHRYLNKIGIHATAEDAVEVIRLGGLVLWNRMSWEEIYRVVEKAASEKKFPLEFINYSFLMTNFTFLNGNDLQRLLPFVSANDEKSKDESSTHFLRRKLGLPDIPTGERSRYRYGEMRRRYNQFGFTDEEIPSIEELLPWMEQITGIYKSFFYDFEPDEVLSETVDISLELLANGVRHSEEFLQKVYKHLEEVFKKKVVTTMRQTAFYRYRRSDGTEKEGISVYPTKDQTDFPVEWRMLIDNLSSEEQFLIYGIIIYHMEFPRLAENFETNFKRAVDVDELQDLYSNALLQLQESLSENQE